jgi:methyl-accepting chemotaxis protein
VNKAVSEMDRVVQQNASSAEESASAAEDMNAQAERMKDYVGDLRSLIDGSKRDAGPRSTESTKRTVAANKTVGDSLDDFSGIG